jgi:hypothetical protein
MLDGVRTSLRAIEREDLVTLLEWRNRPQFRRHFREYRELSGAQQELWYKNTVLGDDRVRMFSIVDRSNGRLIGACGLCYIDWINRNADFSLYVGVDDLYIDDVYAPDAGRALLNHGFAELNLHRIWSEIYDFDHRKERLFATLGFSIDGRHRQTHWTEGRWCDSLFYSILRPEHSPIRTEPTA